VRGNRSCRCMRGVFAEWFKPLLQERALTDRYHVVSYHRVSYAGSRRLTVGR
jgi:hypothetical protein